MKELWVNIKFKIWNHYQVSNLGRLRNLRTKRFIRASKGPRFYYSIGLINKKRRKTFLVHRLVAEAFCKKPTFSGVYSLVVHHKDGNSSNNNANNLIWTTQLNNIRLRKHNKGIQRPDAKLTEIDVKAIKWLWKSNRLVICAISKIFPVNTANIYKIVKNKAWKHLTI